MDIWTIISTILNVLLLCGGIWQLMAARADAKLESEKKKSQVKIWMNDANGVQQALRRIVSDNLDKRYSTTNDMANTIWATQASAFSLYQSLYEERCVTEEEYKDQQKKIAAELEEAHKKQQEAQEQLTNMTVDVSAK